MQERFYLNLNDTMNKSTGFFDQPLQPIEQVLHSVPKLDNWTELRVTDRVVISGVISHHPKHRNGMRILTSLVESYGYDPEGRIFALTKNSRYELGRRIEICRYEYRMDGLASANPITTEVKQTIG